MGISKFLTAEIVYHGPGAISMLPQEIARLGGEHPCIVTDSGLTKTKVVDRVKEAAETAVLCFDKVVPEPPIELVYQCVDFIKENKCDILIALGGGSSMDTAKMSSVVATNGGKVPDYFGVNKVPKAGIPVIAVPTTAGTGSEASPAAVFVDKEAKAKKGLRSDFLLPRSVLLDPELTVSLPQSLTASTGIDALTHAIECYTSVNSTIMGDFTAEKSIEMIDENLRNAYANGGDIEARNGMLMASYIAGISLAVSNVGIVHALAHTLGGMHQIPHGTANSLFLPYVMEFNRIACREKYANVAELLGENIEGLSLDEASLQAVDAVRSLTRDLNIPQSLKDLGLSENILDSIAENCMATQGRIIGNNPRMMNLEETKQILRKAFHGE